MEVSEFLDASDRALRTYLTTSDEADAQKRLGLLVQDVIRPAAQQTVFGALRSWSNLTPLEHRAAADEFRDLAADVESQMAVRLHKLRASVQKASSEESRLVADQPIRNLARYVSSVARKACQDRRRRQRPGRKALADALRYALTHTDGLALWQAEGLDGQPELHCGRSEWRQRRPDSLDDRREALRRDLADISRRQALAWLFDRVGAPLRFEALVDLLASAWDVDARYATLPLEYAETVADRGPGPAPIASLIDLLAEIWERVRILDKPQPGVLLLQLPDSYSQNMLREFAGYGIASEDELARAVGLPLERLQALYARLPLTDQEIAQELGLESTKVRGIRQSARRRLKRISGAGSEG
jgi:hypothetical protein